MPDETKVQKIRKLLALADSGNPHEAALAAARARELMIQYAIDESQLTPSEREPIETQKFDLGTQRIPHWEAILASVLAPSFFCKSFYYKGSDIVCAGRKSDREALIATFYYLRGEIRKMSDYAWKNLPKSIDNPVHGKTWKTAFNEGCVRTISDRLEGEQAKLSSDNTGTALVLVQRQKETNDWVEENLNLRYSMTRRSVNGSGYNAGKVAGKTLDLSKRAGASKALAA